MRQSWDEYWLTQAEQTATRSTCNRLHVGCVLVDRFNKIITTGYNGSIHGHPHCDEVGCLIREGRCIRTLHAEMNALLHADMDRCRDGTAYVSHEPCENCTKALNQVYISRVVFRHPYSNEWNNHFITPMEWIHLPGGVSI